MSMRLIFSFLFLMLMSSVLFSATKGAAITEGPTGSGPTGIAIS